MHIPIRVSGVQWDETGGEVFDIAPATMELLQKVTTVAMDTSFGETYLFIPQLVLNAAWKIKNQQLSLSPPSQRGYGKKAMKKAGDLARKV